MYEIRWLQELAWAVVIAVAVVLFSALLTFDETTLAEWRTWLTGLLVSVVRVVAATVLNEIRKRFPSVNGAADGAA